MADIKLDVYRLLAEYHRYIEQEGGLWTLDGFFEWLKDEVVKGIE